ncbi:MAG TPA: TolC family protein, partial [Terriglobales bacterium]|nr:TolC family protein [Terriglobales bacterium]
FERQPAKMPATFYRLVNMKNLNRVLSAGLGLLLFLIAATSLSSAQVFQFPKAASQFPNFMNPYLPVQVPQPTLTNTPRLDTLMKNGKLMLSLSDAVALALENNLDIAIARYNLSIADTDILRAKAGAQIRGVATGLVQGTPGGGVGGFGTGAQGSGAGGTSGGAGGAGGGASGLVESTLGTGSQIQSYDPQLTAKLDIEHLAQPINNAVTIGQVPVYQQNTGNANFEYSQAFASGTQMILDFNNLRGTDNGQFDLLVPQVFTQFRVELKQHLLAGFGPGPNLRFIRIAKNNREISDVAFRNQVIATVSQIQNIYWDLVSAYEDDKVKERSLNLAEKTLSDNREQVRIGALPAIEVTQAENEVSSRKQDLIIAQTGLQLQQLLIKNAITRNLSDPFIAAAPVIPTDTMYVPQQEPVRPVQDLLNDAYSHRPDLAQARIDLTNREISRKSAKNALLPTVDLVSWYGTSALAGIQNAAFTCAPGVVPNPNAIECLPPGTVAPTGYGHAFSTLFHNTFPDYAVGFQINIPFRNRAAKADQIRSELEYRQAQMRLQQLQNEIGIEVRNAQFALQQNRARVEAATTARDLAQHTFEIEQKKYALGASTSYQVLQTQRDLAQADSARVAAMAAYEKSRVELDRVTGLTLTHNGIEIGDAESGHVNKAPEIPGVAPRSDTSDQKMNPDNNLPGPSL